MHVKPGTIVVGVDGSPHAMRALQWAIKQSVAERRPLTLVHTVSAVTPAFMDAAIVSSQDARSALEVAGRAVLKEARTKVEWTAPELEVHEVFDLVDPRELLLALSEHAAMLVVGSRGRGQLRSMLLGSVSVFLTRHAHCPVAVVRPFNAGTVRHGVLVGVDTAPESRPVLEFAYRQASLRALPLTLLDCVRDFQADAMGTYLVPNAPTDLEDERLALAEVVAGMGEKYPDVHVTTTLARGLPQQALVDMGARMDLVVVGAHQWSRFTRALLGSVSVAVVEHAEVPVVVVPVSR